MLLAESLYATDGSFRLDSLTDEVGFRGKISRREKDRLLQVLNSFASYFLRLFLAAQSKADCPSPTARPSKPVTKDFGDRIRSLSTPLKTANAASQYTRRL